MRAILCLPMNGRKSVNAIRNMMADILVTMPSGSFGSSSRLGPLWSQGGSVMIAQHYGK